jgi:hypothetical protein
MILPGQTDHKQKRHDLESLCAFRQPALWQTGLTGQMITRGISHDRVDALAKLAVSAN